MKAKEMREMTNDELNAKLSTLKADLFKLRFNHAVGQLTNTSQLTTVKKDIARIKTIIRERELKAAEGSSAKGSAKV